MPIDCVVMAFNKSIATELAMRIINLGEASFFDPSSYQSNFISFVVSGTGNGIAKAVAGSGKTTTIMQSMNELRKKHGRLDKPKIHTVTVGSSKSSEQIQVIDYDGIRFRTGTTHSIAHNSAKNQFGYALWNGKVNYLLKGTQSDKTVAGGIYVPKRPHMAQKIINEVWQQAKRRAYGNKRKEQKLAKEVIYKGDSTIKKLVGIMKNVGMGLFPNMPMTIPKALELLDYYDLIPFIKDKEAKEIFFSTYSEKEICRIALQILKDNNTILGGKTIWDFDDMFYLSALFSADLPKYDFVFLDECQDTNLVTQALVLGMLKRDRNGKVIGRAIAVGDTAQAIYGFRGADSTAMEKFEKNFNATILPLSLCYRCGKSIIEKVNNITMESPYLSPNIARQPYTQIESLPSADHGMVYQFPYVYSDLSEDLKKQLFSGDAGVICRKNAPLFSLAYKLIASGITPNFMGRDQIGKSLIEKFTDLFYQLRNPKGKSITDGNRWYKFSYNGNSIKEFSQKLPEIYEVQIENAKYNGNDNLVESLIDEEAGINFILSQCRQLHGDKLSIEKFEDTINSLFSEEKKAHAVTLCSVHKSKGLEFHRAIILDFDSAFIPKFVRQEQWIIQEYNMVYVAFTRAEKELVFLNSVEDEE